MINSPAVESKVHALSARTAATVRALREYYGFTQPELANRSGLTAAALGKIERGERAINIDTLDALARAFNFVETTELVRLVEVCADVAARRAYFDEIAHTLDELLDDIGDPVIDPGVESDSGELSSSRGEERGESRVFSRVPFRHRVAFIGKDCLGIETVYEVSRGGLSMSVDRCIRPGSIVRVILEDITNGATPVVFDARVVWCEVQVDSNTTEFRAGLQTLHDDPGTLAGMSAVFYAALAWLAARSREGTAAQPLSGLLAAPDPSQDPASSPW
ncbi:MAG: helix-turn-helix domain-containing protein [Candidatus Hydrogenedentota bacterium]